MRNLPALGVITTTHKFSVYKDTRLISIAVKLKNYNKLQRKKRLQLLRLLLISIAFISCWHVLGTSLFEVPEIRASETNSYFNRRECMPYPSATLDFEATAYCDIGITKSGVPTAPGIVAGDPEFLPLGSWIHLEAPGYTGIYRVMDTGRLVKGKIIDIFIPGYQTAIEFGRQKVKVTILKHAPFRRKAAPLLNLE